MTDKFFRRGLRCLMLVRILLVVAFFQMVQAADTINSLIKAVANGCGNRVYTKQIDTPEIDELAHCYRTALDELPRKRLPAIEMAFQICQSFKAELQQFVCMDRFKDEAHDPNLYKIFNECASTDKNLYKKSMATYTCMKKKKADYPTETSLDVKLSDADKTYIKTAWDACGKGEAISSTSIGKKEVEGLVDCYQSALLGLEKALPDPYTQALDHCQHFVLNAQKVECIKRVAYESQDANMQRSVSTCLDNSRKGDKRKRQRSFKKPEAFYGKGYDCLRKDFKEFAVDSKERGGTGVPSQPAPPSSSQR